MTKIKFGWVPNMPDSRDYLVDDLGLNPGESADVSLYKYAHVRNQKSVPSCVGEAVAGAMGITQTIKTGDEHVFSSLFPYWYARYIQGNHRKLVGTSIRLACKAITDLGIPEEEYWPFSTNPITTRRQPSPNATMQAHGRANGGYAHIKSGGDAKLNAIRKALLSGYPVVFGTSVDNAFLKNGSPVISRPVGTSVGGHAMVFTGFYTSSTRGLLFEVLNSWGTGWRAGGRCWFTEDFVVWDQVRDLTIMYGWKDIGR